MEPAKILVSRAQASAWTRALRVGLSIRGVLPFEASDSACHARATGDSPAAYAALCEQMVHASLLRFDQAALVDWARQHAALAQEHARIRARASVSLGWANWARGAGLEDERLREAERALANAGDAAGVIEAATLRGLARLADADLDASRTATRRASRMARTERIPVSEYFAHLALARFRRASGHAYLAARIARGLGRVVPESFRPWVEWELSLGDPTQTSGLASVAPIVEAARTGAYGAFDAAIQPIAARVDGVVPFSRELRDVRAALDPRADVAAHAWLRGADDVPGAIVGLSHHRKGDAASVYVVAQPGLRGRRLLAAGLPLFFADNPGALASSHTARKRERVQTCIAALALAGPEGLSDEALFEPVYGFVYDEQVHRGTFNVLKTRVRAQLEGSAELHRVARQNVLELGGPMALVDPRCLPAVRLEVLQVLTQGSADAKEIAGRLNIAVRTAQQALKSLVSDGACDTSREGRRVEYALEDTTYAEPTIT